MKMYIVNAETVALVEELDVYGNNCTRIIEGRNTFVVEISLRKIFEDTLNYYCTTIEGAIRGAKSILGEKYHPPILINATEDLIMLPCGPIRRRNSIWIASNQIMKFEQLGKETIIFTEYGHQIIVPLKISQIEMKIGQASRLLTTQEFRKKKNMFLYYDREKGIILRMKTGERNMFVEKREKNSDDAKTADLGRLAVFKLY